MRNLKKYCIGYLIVASVVMSGCEFTSDETPYDLAVDGNIQELKRHLDEGLDINKPYEPDGRTLLYGAVVGKRYKAIKFLIERGADVNLRDNYENTPLIHAVDHGQNQIVSLLLDHGARVSDINKAGFTALYMAVYRGYSKAAQLLLDRGARINFQDESGNTPLHVAARNNDIELVQLLLDRKARVSIKNKRGFTPLYAPEELSYRETSNLLKKYRARLAKSDAPTPSNLKKWYGQIAQKSPVRVRRVIKQEGDFRKLVYSDDGMQVAGTFKKFISNEDIPLEFENMELSEFINMDELLNRRFTQSVRVFDTRTWTSRYLLTDEKDPPSGDVFSLDGQYLLSEGKESTVHVWDLAAGEVTRSFGKERGNVLDLGKFSETNYLLVGEQIKLEIGESTGVWDFISFFFREFVGETDHSIWLFDFESGEIIRNLSGHKGRVFRAQFTPDGRYVASLGRNFVQPDGMLQNWNMKTGERLPVPEGMKNIRDLTVFPDSKRLALIKSKETVIVDLETGEILKQFWEGGYHLGLMDQGQLLVCLNRKRLVFLDSETGEVKSDLSFEKEFNKLGDGYKLSEYFLTMAVSPHGDTLLATTNHGKMIVFELKSS